MRRPGLIFGVLWFGATALAADYQELQRLLARQAWSEARAQIEEALAAEPKDAALWNLRGIVEASDGHAAEAEKAFAEAVRWNPRLTGAWMNLGRLYLLDAGRADGPDQALRAYQAALKAEPGNAEAHHQAALVLEWKGRFRESLEQLRLLPAADQKRRSARVIRCADEAATGKTATALELAQQIAADAEFDEADVTSILPVLKAHGPAVAVRLLEALEAKGLASAEAKAELAGLYEAAGNATGARKLYGALPATAGTLTSLARVEFREKDFEAALATLGQARDLEPGNASIHYLFGLTCNELRLPLEARKSLEKAIELAPENADYNYALGAIRLQWKETDGALPYLLRYAALRPEDPRGQLALAYAYLTMNRDEEARAALERIPAKGDVEASAEFLRARLAARRGDNAEAIGHLRTVTRLRPKDAEAHAELGSALLAQGDAAGADQETRAALAIDADNRVANRSLMRIYRDRHDPRLEQQTARLKSLAEKSDEEMRLLQRSVEVRPW